MHLPGRTPTDRQWKRDAAAPARTIMRHLRTLVACTLLMLTAANASAEPLSESIIRQVSAWQPGEPVPADLLEFRKSASCFALPTDTSFAFSQLKDYDLLQAILLAPCDRRVFQYAADRALDIGGPNRFYGDLRRLYATHPELLSTPEHQRLRALTGQAHVVVDALFICDKDMPLPHGEAVLAQVAAELRAGNDFHAVMRRYQDAHTYTKFETLTDGKIVTMQRTRVGNFGDFLISPAGGRAFMRSAELPAGHAQPLLESRAGDVLVLRDEPAQQTILYRVREAYQADIGTDH